MRDIAFIFFLAAVLCVTGGMIWGLQMAASGDHAMVGAHAHLNLVGWATMALFAIYYRLTPRAAQGWLPRIHAAAAILGSMLTFASILIFLFTVVRYGFGAAQADHRRARLDAALTPAE